MSPPCHSLFRLSHFFSLIYLGRQPDFQASFETLQSFGFSDLHECCDIIWLDIILHLKFK